jgi:hypothetical protein
MDYEDKYYKLRLLALFEAGMLVSIIVKAVVA